MSTYHLHARMLEGGLAAPTRNELQSSESDDRGEIVDLAKRLAARGFAVWVYEHGPDLGPDGEGRYQVVAEWSGHGERVR